jgi:DNA-binding SARP family transcriptional activator
MGDRPRAAKAARRFESVEDSAPPAVHLFARLARASFQWCFGSAEIAERHAQEGLEIVARHGLSQFEFRLLRQASYAALARGDVHAATMRLQRMQELASRFSGLDMAFFHHASAMTRAHQGDLEGADLHAEEALRLARASGHQFSIASCAYVQLNVALLRGDDSRVEARLSELRGLAVTTRSRILILWSRTGTALLALHAGHGHRLRAIASALRISRALRGYAQPWVPRILLSRLYATALEYGIETRHVDMLIRRFDFAAPESGPVPESWPYAVRISALGRFRVYVNDKPLAFATKVQRKPLEMLKVMIALGGKGVREDSICESLWPDAEADAAARALTSTLHRLRRLLGEDSVHRQSGQLTLDSRRCRVDAWMLERLLNTLAGACRGADFAEIAQLLTRALEAYQGQLLQSEPDAPWLLVARERLHAKVLRHVETASRRLVDGGRLAQAIGAYHRAIEIDPLNESLYRGLMECHLAANQPAEALRTFERCGRVLTAGLGVAPSSDTVLLVQHLLAARTS